MTRWEYQYIDLYRGEPDYTHSPGSPGADQRTADTEFTAFVDEVDQAGADGWEAIGEVCMTFGPTDIRVLMLKRAV